MNRYLINYIKKYGCCSEGTLIGEGPPGALPGSPKQFYFDSVGDILYIYDGTGWTTTTNLKHTIPTADTTATGNTTNEFQTGYTTVLGDLVYLDTTGKWALVDANVVTGYDCLLGIVLQGGITSGNAVNVALPGTFIYMASAFPTFTIGKPIYMSETAGAVTQTQPVTADAAIRVIGYTVHSDKMYFFPTGVDFITHT